MSFFTLPLIAITSEEGMSAEGISASFSPLEFGEKMSDFAQVFGPVQGSNGDVYLISIGIANYSELDWEAQSLSEYFPGALVTVFYADMENRNPEACYIKFYKAGKLQE